VDGEISLAIAEAHTDLAAECMSGGGCSDSATLLKCARHIQDARLAIEAAERDGGANERTLRARWVLYSVFSSTWAPRVLEALPRMPEAERNDWASGLRALLVRFASLVRDAIAQSPTTTDARSLTDAVSELEASLDEICAAASASA
jgi:hypothetical protein